MKGQKKQSKLVTVKIPLDPPIPLRISIIKRKDGLRMARKQVSGEIIVAYGSTEDETVSKFIQAFLNSRSTAQVQKPAKNTYKHFADWLDLWLETRLRIGNKQLTKDTYKSIAQHHIKPWVGAIQLAELKEADFITMCHNIRKTHSQATTSQALFICRACLKSAVEENIIIANPIHKISVKRKAVREKVSLTPMEVNLFLESAKKHRQYTAFLVFIVLGLRRNELLGLKWTDFNSTEQCLQIARGLFKAPKVIGRPIEFNATKTESSCRSIPIPEWLILQLMKHKENQISESIKANAEKAPELIFCRRDGNPYHPDYMSRLFKSILNSAGIRYAKLHDLRRTCATLALNRGATPRTVAELLGHSSTRMVNEVYTVSAKIDKERAVNAVGSILLPTHSIEDTEISSVSSSPEKKTV